MPASKRNPRKAAPAKSRSVVPIPDTIESIKGFPDKLVIFKVPASPFWWVRYFDGKPIKRSTKTENRQEAIRFAKKFYETVLVNNALGHSNNPKVKSFVLCADAVINEDQEKAKRVRQWWWAADGGRVCVNIRYGSKILELAKGKSTVEVASADELINTLSLVQSAVVAGELDTQIEAASGAVRKGFRG